MFHLKIIIAFNSRDILQYITRCVCVMLWGIFFRRSRAANSTVWSNQAEIVLALMHVIGTCKYEKERMKTAEFQTHLSSHVYNHYLQV